MKFSFMFCYGAAIAHLYINVSNLPLIYFSTLFIDDNTDKEKHQVCITVFLPLTDHKVFKPFW